MKRENSWGWTQRTTFTVIYLAGWRSVLPLTDLKLSLDASFTPLPEVHLGLVVFGHHLHKLPGQHCILGGKGREKERLKENAWRRQRFDNDKVAAISWCSQLNSYMMCCYIQDLAGGAISPQLWAARSLCGFSFSQIVQSKVSLVSALGQSKLNGRRASWSDKMAV